MSRKEMDEGGLRWWSRSVKIASQLDPSEGFGEGPIVNESSLPEALVFQVLLSVTDKRCGPYAEPLQGPNRGLLGDLSQC